MKTGLAARFQGNAAHGMGRRTAPRAVSAARRMTQRTTTDIVGAGDREVRIFADGVAAAAWIRRVRGTTGVVHSTTAVNTCSGSAALLASHAAFRITAGVTNLPSDAAGCTDALPTLAHVESRARPTGAATAVAAALFAGAVWSADTGAALTGRARTATATRAVTPVIAALLPGAVRGTNAIATLTHRSRTARPTGAATAVAPAGFVGAARHTIAEAVGGTTLTGRASPAETTTAVRATVFAGAIRHADAAAVVTVRPGAARPARPTAPVAPTLLPGAVRNARRQERGLLFPFPFLLLLGCCIVNRAQAERGQRRCGQRAHSRSQETPARRVAQSTAQEIVELLSVHLSPFRCDHRPGAVGYVRPHAQTGVRNTEVPDRATGTTAIKPV